jgi:hypothetical protein
MAKNSKRKVTLSHRVGAAREIGSTTGFEQSMEIADKVGVHPKVPEVLQEPVEAVQVHHARRFGQKLAPQRPDVVDCGMQDLNRLIQHLGQSDDPDTRARVISAKAMCEGILDTLQSCGFDPD